GAIPDLEHETERLSPIEGLMPDPANLPSGCAFAERCPYRMDICEKAHAAVYTDGTHRIACNLYADENNKGEA
ncbi:MAG TPA: ABC transporter ATP-binding protein, partial [Clostridia bacterium]|nr:ABC transporter ATP-binding protein [Clostridia bacterium]